MTPSHECPQGSTWVVGKSQIVGGLDPISMPKSMLWDLPNYLDPPESTTSRSLSFAEAALEL